MIKPSSVDRYLNSKNQPTYSRLNFDAFLKEVAFKFTKDAIHITGTNGKGSTAYFLSSVLKNSNYKVGRFISPCFTFFYEMISINDREIRPSEFVEILNEYYEAIERHQLTQFEILTFIALTYFNRQKINLALIEVGMGGKIDATNIFRPILSIITNVSVEHTAYLGATTKEIAMHKAGIIKKKVPVLVGNMPLDAFSVIAATAMKKDAPLYGVKAPLNIKVSRDGICFDALDYKNICLGIPASYEASNAALALNALEIIANKYPVDRDLVFKSMKNVKIPARFSIVSERPLFIIDGAHNPMALSALINSIKMLNRKKLHIVFASFKDKDVEQAFDLFALSDADVVTTTFNHSRARNEIDYNSYYPFVEDYHQAIEMMSEKAQEDEVILVTGSLYFAQLVYSERG